MSSLTYKSMISHGGLNVLDSSKKFFIEQIMILILGLFTSLYAIFLINNNNLLLIRSSILILLSYLLFNVYSVIYIPHSDIMFMDGLCNINTTNLNLEIFAIILSIIYFYMVSNRIDLPGEFTLMI